VDKSTVTLHDLKGSEFNFLLQDGCLFQCLIQVQSVTLKL